MVLRTEIWVLYERHCKVNHFKFRFFIFRTGLLAKFCPDCGVQMFEQKTLEYSLFLYGTCGHRILICKGKQEGKKVSTELTSGVPKPSLGPRWFPYWEACRLGLRWTCPKMPVTILGSFGGYSMAESGVFEKAMRTLRQLSINWVTDKWNNYVHAMEY